MATSMEAKCRTVGELRDAVASLDEDMPLVGGLGTMFEKNIATGRTRNVVCINRAGRRISYEIGTSDPDDFDIPDHDDPEVMP